jgi:hypothetical protein
MVFLEADNRFGYKHDRSEKGSRFLRTIPLDLVNTVEGFEALNDQSFLMSAVFA